MTSNSKAYEAAHQYWLHKVGKARAIAARLQKDGFEVSKSTVDYWIKGFEKEPPEPKITLPATIDHSAVEIPRELQDVLSPRLRNLTEAVEIDRVGAAIMKVAEAIAERAPDIAKMLLDTETEETSTVKDEDGTETSKKVQKAQVARSAVSALAQCAEAVQTLTQARTMISVAHRNLNEGDMLGASGRKEDAKARRIFEEGRGNRAKEIEGSAIAVDPDEEQGALAALRGLSGRK